MVFSSIIFTFLFLPVVLGLYYAIRNDRWRNGVLLAASILFYAYGEPRFVLVMLASILGNYLFALAIDHAAAPQYRKLFLVLDVVMNLAVFFIFKYLNFAVEVLDLLPGVSIPVPGIALPIGISFFTFQAMSYVFDVYRKDTAVQKSPFRLALYIAFFPQLIAGPIVRYKQIAEQIESHRVITPERFGYGCKRFMLGFSKKVILANNLSTIADQTFSFLDFAQQGHSVLFYWLGAVAYTLQIFFDFSGYSDMAIGLGEMFGFDFEENFRYPYVARSVTDFWRRWHISLSSWFRDYVYIPLGGSRVSVPRHIFNLFVVWLLTGIWHGADYQFIAWGMIYFVFLVLEKYVIRPEQRAAWLQFVWRVVTILLVVFNWVLFRSVGLGQGVQYCLAMLGRYAGTAKAVDTDVIWMLRDYWFYFAAGIVFSTPVALVLRSRCRQSERLAKGMAVLVPAGELLVFLWAVSFLVMGAHNPFIYFNF